MINTVIEHPKGIYREIEVDDVAFTMPIPTLANKIPMALWIRTALFNGYAVMGNKLKTRNL